MTTQTQSPTRSVIQQSVVLPASADALHAMYLDAAQHASFTGFPVEISPKPGSSFTAFGGQLSGQLLATVTGRLIVQSWRSTKFHAADPDSTLFLSFTNQGTRNDECRIDLVHLDVPLHDYDDVVEGWRKYYWEPWRIYLEQRK